MTRPKRKPNRLPHFDYGEATAYFITVCTRDRVNLFWEDSQNRELSPWGRIVEDAITKIPQCYDSVEVKNYVVMPNHIHLLLQIRADDCGRALPGPTISTVIQQMKGYTSKRAGRPIWQKSFHDHVVRCEKDYLEIWKYIDNNPAKWTEDCFYMEL